MALFTQVHRPMAVTTPLGPDALLLVGFRGQEAISQLFRLQLDLGADKRTPVPFPRVVGQNVTVRIDLPGSDGKRYFNGIVRRFTQAGSDEDFNHFRAELVPQFWLWTKQVQSRIFQHLTVPDILKQALAGLDVSFQIAGSYHPRDYCVQYRESDFAFASRLMEEEGIYYYFEHAAGSHRVVVGDQPAQHPDLPAAGTIYYDEVRGGTRPENRIVVWEKSQELRSGKYTLWDHCFELPAKNLEARQTMADAVPVGRVNHPLQVGGNDRLEIYDYPGGYAQRFDGVDRGGGDRSADLAMIFEDNKRTVKIRMEQEAVPGLEVRGVSDCPHLTPGYRFTLARHGDGDGPYLVTGVEHAARLDGNYRGNGEGGFEYRNELTALPAALPYRPAAATPRPTVPGMQTAVVVGPPGEEVFCDKYGRVKVQFFWDRQGKRNANSSCWIRVGQMAAGRGFGAVNLPRIGQEVIVGFLEGDPDQPIIVGSVYNAENMPPYKLPDQRHFTGVVHRSHGGVTQNASELRFENQLGQERMLLHSETDLHQSVENAQHVHVGRFHSEVVGGKVVWDRGLLGGASSPAAAGSGAGGGSLPAPAADRPSDASTDGADLRGLTAPGLADAAPGTPAGSGAGGGDFDEKTDSQTDTGVSPDGRPVKAAKLRPILGGSDNTIDDAGKMTFVRQGSLTDVFGGSRTRVFKRDISPLPDYAAHGDPATVWATPKADANNPNPIAPAFAQFPYPLDVTGFPFDVANTTEIHGSSHTTIYGDSTTEVLPPSADPTGLTSGGAGNTNTHVAGNVTTQIDGDKSATVNGNSHTDVGGNASTEVHGQKETTVHDGNFSTVYGVDWKVFLGTISNTLLLGLLSMKFIGHLIDFEVNEAVHMKLHDLIHMIVVGAHTETKTPAGTVDEGPLRVSKGIGEIGVP